MSRDAHKATPPPMGIAESGVRDLRSQLLEQRKQFESLTKKNNALADELEDVTVRLLRAEAELATSKEREAESARQWLAMSGDLSAARAVCAKHERLLVRVTEMLAALNDRARGSVVESEIDAIVGVLELHHPDHEH
jgi:predicted transcriptional regulator